MHSLRSHAGDPGHRRENDALQRDRFSMTRNPEVLFTPRTDPGNMGRRQSRFKF